MTHHEIAQMRLQSQMLAKPFDGPPEMLVHRFGAIQAQDYQMSKWAVGIRAANSSNETIERAIDEGKIIRTHVLRPTWHLVAAEDLRWMLELTGPNIMRQMSAINKTLNLDEACFKRCNDQISKMLEGGKHLTREQIMKNLNEKGIDTSGLRSSHIMFNAEITGLVCSGKRNGKNNTYALIDERVPAQNPKSKEESLTGLANRYFTSHGPATGKDFQWWSGLSARDARKAVSLAEVNFANFTLDGEVYYFTERQKQEHEKILFLPAFDEYLISYKNRRASIEASHAPAAFTKNGIFRPVIVVNGKVIGTWSRSVSKGELAVTPLFFEPASRKLIDECYSAAEKYSNFMSQKLTFEWREF